MLASSDKKRDFDSRSATIGQSRVTLDRIMESGARDAVLGVRARSTMRHPDARAASAAASARPYRLRQTEEAVNAITYLPWDRSVDVRVDYSNGRDRVERETN